MAAAQTTYDKFAETRSLIGDGERTEENLSSNVSKPFLDVQSFIQNQSPIQQEANRFEICSAPGTQDGVEGEAAHAGCYAKVPGQAIGSQHACSINNIPACAVLPLPRVFCICTYIYIYV